MFTTSLHSLKQVENGRKCGKRSTIDAGDYYVTHAMHTFETTCNVPARNNFEFTLLLMTAGLLNTEGFQKLKYCIRSKGFLEHQKAGQA